MKVRTMAFGARAGGREERGPVINIPVRRVLAGIRVDDCFVVRCTAAAGGENHNDGRSRKG